jgi:hypothetical protein
MPNCVTAADQADVNVFATESALVAWLPGVSDTAWADMADWAPGRAL